PISPGEVIDGEPDRELVPQNATTEVRYEVGKQEEHVNVTAGAIRRMTVGVLVPRGLAEEQRQHIADTVASAIGLDPVHRGDAISVQELAPVSAASPAKAASAPSKRTAGATFAGLDAWIWAVGAALAVLLVSYAAFSLGRSGGPPRLSVLERERMLTDLRRWLDDEAATPGSSRS
ncbi:MAG: flagellar M-ring protein FliF C-terminal domain-containing protein, partial [Burkholderiales bacterium]